MSDTCSTCGHWSAELPALATGTRRPEGFDPRIGVCQLYPPEIVHGGGMCMSRFPEVHADRTCGEWSPGMPEDGGGEEVDHNVVPFGRVAA